MKNNYVPIIREKVIQIPPRSVEEFLADTVESRRMVDIMLQTYREFLTNITAEHLEIIKTDQIILHYQYISARGTLYAFFKDLLESLELLWVAKERLESINNDVDSIIDRYQGLE